jgi:hypothetical protein
MENLKRLPVAVAIPRSKSVSASKRPKEERKQAILGLLRQGLPSRVIADSLGVGIRTVAAYKAASVPVRSKDAAAEVEEYVPDQIGAQRKAADTTERGAAITRVGIRRVLARHRWQLVSLLGPSSIESTGVVNLLAVRQDLGNPPPGLKRGDKLQMLLIQVKGGETNDATEDEIERLRKVARLHGACGILLTNWKKGTDARFHRVGRELAAGGPDWTTVVDNDAMIG